MGYGSSKEFERTSIYDYERNIFQYFVKHNFLSWQEFKNQIIDIEQPEITKNHS